MTEADKSDLTAKGMLSDPGDHFTGRFEVERKYKVSNLSSMRKKLVDAGAKAFMRDNIETDYFYDTADGTLKAAGKQLVLRSMAPSGRTLWFVKGPSAYECVSTDLPDFSAAQQLLASLGYVEVDRLIKERDLYFLGAFHLTLDTIKPFGSFVEVAVMTDDADALKNWSIKVEALAEKLGLSADMLITQSYREMMVAR